MYRSFYGLSERPFDLTSDPRYLCLTPKHQEALGMVRYGLQSRRGLALLVGEAGTGKTTLVRTALHEASGPHAGIAFISNPTLTRAEFIEYLAAAFGLDSAAADSKTRFLLQLERLLLERQQRGLLSALVVDEAQSLPDELLEEIRLLANMETINDKLLTVVLAGQPELADRLNQGSLRQLKQRIALRCVLEPLDLAETATYISQRIRVAGGVPQELFSREAVEEIHRQSRGVPRTISVICDNSLLSGFAQREKPVTLRTINDVCCDFELLAAPASLTAEDDIVDAPAANGRPAAQRASTASTHVLGSRRPAVPAAAPVPVRHAFDPFGLRSRFLS